MPRSARLRRIALGVNFSCRPTHVGVVPSVQIETDGNDRLNWQGRFLLSTRVAIRDRESVARRHPENFSGLSAVETKPPDGPRATEVTRMRSGILVPVPSALMFGSPASPSRRLLIVLLVIHGPSRCRLKHNFVDTPTINRHDPNGVKVFRTRSTASRRRN